MLPRAAGSDAPPARSCCLSQEHQQEGTAAKDRSAQTTFCCPTHCLTHLQPLPGLSCPCGSLRVTSGPSTAHTAASVLLLLSALLHRRAAFPKAPAQAGSSEAANRWPGAYTGGPEATIWRRPVILLLGDSITQMGSNEYDGAPGWVAHMQAHYNRKVRELVGVQQVQGRSGALGGVEA